MEIDKFRIKIEVTDSEKLNALSKQFSKSNLGKFVKFAISESRRFVEFFMNIGKEFLYENCEELLTYLYNENQIINKQELSNGLNQGLNRLNSDRFLYFLPNQRHFLLRCFKNKISLIPSIENSKNIHNQYLNIIQVASNALEGFSRTQIKLNDLLLDIGFYDEVDQFYYVMKEIISSDQIFEQNFNVSDFMATLAKFITKNVVLEEIKNLSVDCPYNSPLHEYRYVVMQARKIFLKIAYDGSLEHLNQDDISFLASAMTYSEEFEKMPPVLANTFNNLNKILPFRVVEKIVRKSKLITYQFK